MKLVEVKNMKSIEKNIISRYIYHYKKLKQKIYVYYNIYYNLDIYS